MAIEVGAPGPLARFPALDPEEARRSWYRRRALQSGAVVAAVAVVAAAVAVVVVTGSGSHSRARAAAVPGAGAGGRIVVATSTGGGIGLSKPGGGRLTTFPQVSVATNTSLAASVDSRYLVTGLGQVIAVDGGGLRVTARKLTSSFTASMSAASVFPFADHDRALVVFTQSIAGNRSSTAGIAVLPLTSGVPTTLGTGDSAAGDPQSEGAFVSVATSDQVLSGSHALLPDARVELRRAGLEPVVLATTTQLEQDVGEDPGEPANVTAWPSPSGDAVAMIVTQTVGSPAGIVVVDRTGRAQWSVRPVAGTSTGGVTWSPDGRSLVYASFKTSGPGITVWKIGSPPRTLVLPFRVSDLGGCLWSPDKSTILCQSFDSSGSPSQWVIARAQGGPASLVAAPGLAVAWLGSGSRR